MSLESFVSVGPSGAITVDTLRYIKSEAGQELLNRLDEIVPASSDSLIPS